MPDVREKGRKERKKKKKKKKKKERKRQKYISFFKPYKYSRELELKRKKKTLPHRFTFRYNDSQWLHLELGIVIGPDVAIYRVRYLAYHN